jgi:hypothetical protein
MWGPCIGACSPFDCASALGLESRMSPVRKLGFRGLVEVLREGLASCEAWRNWQTRGTQNPVGLTPREGSTPSLGTPTGLSGGSQKC